MLKMHSDLLSSLPSFKNVVFFVPIPHLLISSTPHSPVLSCQCFGLFFTYDRSKSKVLSGNCFSVFPESANITSTIVIREFFAHILPFARSFG